MDSELLKAALLLAQDLERLVRNIQAQARAREQSLPNLNRGFHLGNVKFDRSALYER